jgi:hypothetical protein
MKKYPDRAFEMAIKKLSESDFSEVYALVEADKNYLSKCYKHGKPLLAIAAQCGFSELAAWLIERCADVNQRFDARSPVTGKTTRGLTALMVCLNHDVFLVLAKAGADLNARADNGNTVFCRLTLKEDAELLETAYTHGARPTEAEVAQLLGYVNGRILQHKGIVQKLNDNFNSLGDHLERIKLLLATV